MRFKFCSVDCLKILSGHSFKITSVIVFLEEKIISGSIKEIKVWHTDSGKCIITLLGHSESIRSIIKLK